METRTFLKIISVFDFCLVLFASFLLWLFLYGHFIYEDLSQIRYAGLISHISPKWNDIAFILLPTATIAASRSSANLRRMVNKKYYGLKMIDEIGLPILAFNIFLVKLTYLGSHFGYVNKFPQIINTKIIIPLSLVSLAMGLILGIFVFVHHLFLLKFFPNRITFNFKVYEETIVDENIEIPAYESENDVRKPEP